MLSRCLRRSNILGRSVAPPFMYGERSSLVSGLIRFNEEISDESRKQIFSNSNFFTKTPFFHSNSDDSVQTLEVVSDDSVARSTDPTHIEAGVGVFVKTEISLPSTPTPLPCGVVMGFTHVGTSNNSQSFHANQARVMCEHYAELSLNQTEDQRGAIMTVYPITESEHEHEEEKLQLSDGYSLVTSVREYTVGSDTLAAGSGAEEFKVEELSDEKEIKEIWSNYIRFQPKNTAFKAHCLVDKDSDSIVCAVLSASSSGSPTGVFVASDPVVTLDCPPGQEKAVLTHLVHTLGGRWRKKVIRYSGNDKVVSPVLDNANSVAEIAVLPIGLSPQQQRTLISNPWSFNNFLP